MRYTIICTLALALPIAASAAPVAPPAPVAGWLFDDGSGTDVTDSFGTNDGTLVDGMWDATNQKLGNSALKFDGSNDYVSVSGFDYYGATGFTLSLWFRVVDNSGSGFQYMFSHGNVLDDPNLNVAMVEDGISPPGIVRTFVNDGSGDTTFADTAGRGDSTSALDDGDWHLLVAVVTEGSGMKFYIDGDLDDTINNGDDAYTPAGLIDIGRRGAESGTPTHYLNGWMDEVVLWDQPLSQDNIDWLWNDGAGNSVAAVPEPATLGLLAIGGLALAGGAVRRRRKV